MKKGTKIGLIVLGLFLLFMFLTYRTFVGTYNELVRMEEDVKNAWAQVQNQYQRRADLIPNLVETVKGYAAHERETLEAVINARARATQVQVDPARLLENPQLMQQFAQAQGQLSSALSRLMVVIERYPDLKANQNFIALQTQLEGTENRIAVERRRFNEAVRNYNQKLRQFPTVLIANMFGFHEKAYFEAAAEAQQVPKVDFTK
ncbi:MAG: LemA family protein [candidate division KSB1 bacterium]|nr:LemA family protein [candidate division KSB1 bacterium]